MSRTRLTLATAAVLAALAVPAQAETDTTSIQLTGGSLSFTQQPLADDFAATALTGAPQLVTTNMNDWKVNDARGTGTGWNVTFQATPFDDGAGHTLPAGSLKMLAPTVTPTNVLNVAVPPVLQGALFTLDGGSAVPVVSALAATGQGEWKFDQLNLPATKDLQLTVPASAYAGTYTSNLTFTLGATP
jgi:putative surface cell wall-binding protein